MVSDSRIVTIWELHFHTDEANIVSRLTEKMKAAIMNGYCGKARLIVTEGCKQLLDEEVK